MGNNFVKELEHTSDKQACMYCKRADTGAGYMNTFEYCPTFGNKQCIRNYYLYINQWMKCTDTTIPGWMLDIDENCDAEIAKQGSCPSEFVSYTGMPTKRIIKKASLGLNQKCTISLDATQ